MPIWRRPTSMRATIKVARIQINVIAMVVHIIYEYVF